MHDSSATSGTIWCLLHHASWVCQFKLAPSCTTVLSPHLWYDFFSIMHASFVTSNILHMIAACKPLQLWVSTLSGCLNSSYVYHKAVVHCQLLTFDPLTAIESFRRQGHACFSILTDNCTSNCALQHEDYQLQSQTYHVYYNLSSLYIGAFVMQQTYSRLCTRRWKVREAFCWCDKYLWDAWPLIHTFSWLICHTTTKSCCSAQLLVFTTNAATPESAK